MIFVLLLGARAQALPAASHTRPKITSKVARPMPLLTGKPGVARFAPAGKGTKKPAQRNAAASSRSMGVRKLTLHTRPGGRLLAPLSTSVRSKPSFAAAANKNLSLRPDPVRNDAPLPAADDPNRERTQNLQEALDQIVHGSVLGRLRVGMRVVDLTSGRVLYSRRGSTLMDPASNQKVLATATALLRLGSTWRFRTELSGPPPDGQGEIAGDLVLHGTGDPSLRSGHLEQMAQKLVLRGVTRVDGRVLGDLRRIGSHEASTGRSPLRLSWSAIEVRVRPGDKVGAAGSASLHPSSEAFRLVNQTTTVRGRNRVGVSIARVGDQFQVTVSGRVGLGRRGVVIRRSPPSDTLYAAIMMRAALVSAGIEVKGSAGVYSPDQPTRVTDASVEGVHLALAHPAGDSSPPILPPRSSSTILAVHESVPLPLLIRRVNKNSDNEWSERVLEAAGAEVYGGNASNTKGVRALREAMGELGISPNGYNPANGSGLGHQNRVTPNMMTDLLHKLYFDPRVGPDILQSLSVGGVDGTTRNRFRGSSAAERVRAKTGTLNGVSCLSGYVGDKADVLAFAILVEGHRRRAVPSVRSAQVSAVNAMMRYARGALGPTPAEEAPAGQDVESGGESAEVESQTDLSETPASDQPSESIDEMLKNFGKPGDEP